MGLGGTWGRAVGPVLDVVTILVAALVVEPTVQAWLMAREYVLFLATCGLHVVAIPTGILMTMSPWTRMSDLLSARVDTWESHAVGWAGAMFLCGSFIVPGVLSLAIDQHLGIMMGTIFGPFVILALGGWLLVVLDRRTDFRFSRKGAAAPPGLVHAVTLVMWAYLLATETTMLVAVSGGGVWASPAVVLLTLAVGYLPTRLFLYLLHDHGWIERVTIVVATGHLLVRVFAASAGAPN